MIENAVDNLKLKAQSFKARFLEAGVVQYEDEMVLIKPDNLMKIADTFKGAHVIIDHQDISEKNLEEIVGYITNVWFNTEDGWAWCDFTVNSEEAINLINQGYSVSCAYFPEYAQGGSYHNISYEREIIGGESIHLAIVENPRYEDAIILKNSIKNKMKNIFKLTSKKEAKENSVRELELENAVFETEEGEEISVANMIEAYKNAKKNEEEEKKKEEAKVNADDEFEIDGEMVKVSELAAAYKSSKKKNEEEEEEKKMNEEEEEKKKEEAKKNCADAFKIKEARAKFENSGASESTKVILDKDRFALGSTAYGSLQKVSK